MTLFPSHPKSQVLLDGVDTKTLGLQLLRSRITMVPQDSVLFSGTLASNLDPWGVVDRKVLEDTLTRIGLSDTLDTVVTEGGANLSHGQRQLVCLGRAVLRLTHCARQSL